MYEKKYLITLTGFVLSASLIAASVTALFLTYYFGQAHFQVLGRFCQAILDGQPEMGQTIASALKTISTEQEIPAEEQIILLYGYTPDSVLPAASEFVRLSAMAGAAAGGMLFLVTLLFRHRNETDRIRMLTAYLEQVNAGNGTVLVPVREDRFSGLEDEIYKTVTMLYQTRDRALETKQNFAENLYNIAHQIKTPITAISLSTQMWREDPSPRYPEQIQSQISRLTHLEEGLLLLSRMDAGTLPLETENVDVFTLLTLAADNLQELLCEAGVSVNIPESGAVIIRVDLDWTMEAVINLLKNSMEHTPSGGFIDCFYEQNPIYTKIRVQDTGTGFVREDIPHLFERFYRGQNAGSGGIGIGLSLSREIIERQNGTITAGNLPGHGAYFEIRFYSH